MISFNNQEKGRDASQAGSLKIQLDESMES